jgi:hypothetical protein
MGLGRNFVFHCSGCGGFVGVLGVLVSLRFERWADGMLELCKTIDALHNKGSSPCWLSR